MATNRKMETPISDLPGRCNRRVILKPSCDQIRFNLELENMDNGGKAIWPRLTREDLIAIMTMARDYLAANEQPTSNQGTTDEKNAD